MDNGKQEFINYLRAGVELPPFQEWREATNLYKIWGQRVSPGDPRWELCSGDPEVFVRRVYSFLENKLDDFLGAVWDSAFRDKGFRDIDTINIVDSNTIRGTGNNPGYFRGVCYREIVECGGDADIRLSMRQAVANTLRGTVRKTFFMPALYPHIHVGSITPNMVLTWNKSTKLVSVFSPNVYRYLLKRLNRVKPAGTVLFPTASWCVPVVAADGLGYSKVGIVDVQGSVLDRCHTVKAEVDRRKNPLFDSTYDLETWTTPSEVMDSVVPPGWDHIISCPPYYDLEMYAGSNQQSTDLYGSYSEWLEGYWRPTALASRRLITPGGAFAFIMGHHIRYRYMSRDLEAVAETAGFTKVDEVRITPGKKSPKLYASTVEKYEICSIYRAT